MGTVGHVCVAKTVVIDLKNWPKSTQKWPRLHSVASIGLIRPHPAQSTTLSSSSVITVDKYILGYTSGIVLSHRNGPFEYWYTGTGDVPE